MEEVVYPYTFIFRESETTLLWETGLAPDRFLLDQDQKIYAAKGVDEVRKNFGTLPFSILWSEAAVLDFDSFWTELDSLNQYQDSSKEVCELLLNGWNFLEDVIRTFRLDDLQTTLLNELLNKSYDKLFRGNNLSAIAPEGSRYHPKWEEGELVSLKASMLHVWNEIAQRTKLWPCLQ